MKRLISMWDILLCTGIVAPPVRAATNYTLVGWNNLGMHCMDSDFSIFSILPPYNTIHAQLIANANGTAWLVTNTARVRVTYEAVADPAGSINRTSVGKGNFWTHVKALFGLELPDDQGLPVPGPEAYSMPGAANMPQVMKFEADRKWFAAYGVPVTPYDDTGKPNTYPLMRLTARTTSGVELAHTDIVLPVSDEMDCRQCHSSWSGPDAQPAGGWVRMADPGRDYRFNILRLHDEERAGSASYRAVLAAVGYNTNGLFQTVLADGKPVLCAACHASEALPGSGQPGVPALTRAVHGRHATVTDPLTGQLLDAEANRTACYACHPGSETRCLRGAMGKAVAADGSLAMQCQSCHGPMSLVGSTNRTGWLDEPNCQACHTGSATTNSGAIRFTSVFSTGTTTRAAAIPLFATNPDTPAPGHSLYRFSAGHGNLQCSACHGSTHAEFPTAFTNDNLQSLALQGHEGMLMECSVCHGTQPNTVTNGPHGMHPLGNTWAGNHANAARSGPGVVQCAACHGANYRGTVLSLAQGPRSVSTKFGTRDYWRGYQVSCYNCHNGPFSSDPPANNAPSVASLFTSTVAGVSMTCRLSTNDANHNPLYVRVVSQARHGTVALNGALATYYPETGYGGTDLFTYAANDGYTESSLATVTVRVDIVDTDADGVPDWWTQLYFGHDAGQAADLSRADDDADGDGMVNLREYISWTDPRDGQSVLRFFSIAPVSTGVEVGVLTVYGRRYAMERGDLRAGTWMPVVTNFWGQTEMARLMQGAGVTSAAYRVRYLP